MIHAQLQNQLLTNHPCREYAICKEPGSDLSIKPWALETDQVAGRFGITLSNQALSKADIGFKLGCHLVAGRFCQKQNPDQQR